MVEEGRPRLFRIAKVATGSIEEINALKARDSAQGSSILEIPAVLKYRTNIPVSNVDRIVPTIAKVRMGPISRRNSFCAEQSEAHYKLREYIM